MQNSPAITCLEETGNPTIQQLVGGGTNYPGKILPKPATHSSVVTGGAMQWGRQITAREGTGDATVLQLNGPGSKSDETRYVTLSPETNHTDTRSQYRMQQFSICG